MNKEEKEYYRYEAQKSKMEIGKDTLIIILLVMIFCVCAYVAVKVIKYQDIYSNDPFVYGAIVHNVSSCSCMQEDGKSFHFNKSSINYKLEVKANTFQPFNPNLFNGTTGNN